MFALHLKFVSLDDGNDDDCDGDNAYEFWTLEPQEYQCAVDNDNNNDNDWPLMPINKF